MGEKNYLEFCLPPQLGPQWAGRTCGLCGNYNGNQGDDFLTDSGLVEASPHAFGQAWRINGDCESTQKFETDPCAVNPKRGTYTHTDTHHSLTWLNTNLTIPRYQCALQKRRVQWWCQTCSVRATFWWIRVHSSSSVVMMCVRVGTVRSASARLCPPMQLPAQQEECCSTGGLLRYVVTFTLDLFTVDHSLTHTCTHTLSFWLFLWFI